MLRRSSSNRVVSRHLLLLICVLLSAQTSSSSSPENYTNAYNRACRYSAHNVSRSLFEDGVDNGLLFFFPLETRHVVVNHRKPWMACFGGPGERLANLTSIAQGLKLPCFYRTNRWGNIDYWEEHACDVLLRSNCYCFAARRYLGSYCEPGLGGTGKALPLPIKDCGPAVTGLIADGAKAVDRETVYRDNPPSSGGHYVALAVKPQADERDSGDFHFWRLDADLTWSYKAGDTLSRNTFRNGTVICLRDLELPETRGHYTEFCGYFQVWPDRLELAPSGYHFSSLPGRFKLWQDMGVNATVQALRHLSPAWLAAYRQYYADAGWEDGLPAGETAAAEAGWYSQPRHTYSVRPYHQPPGS